ncbi:MAG: hypothetical protein ACRDTT_07895 [Pseudonocardiaceae bacterium]
MARDAEPLEPAGPFLGRPGQLRTLSSEPFQLADKPGDVRFLGGGEPLRPRAAEAGKLESFDVAAAQARSQRSRIADVSGLPWAKATVISDTPSRLTSDNTGRLGIMIADRARSVGRSWRLSELHRSSPASRWYGHADIAVVEPAPEALRPTQQSVSPPTPVTSSSAGWRDECARTRSEVGDECCAR